jgi:hypothetical protein
MTEDETESRKKIPTVQKVIAVLWPSFLVAGIETVVFFTLFDPLFVLQEYSITRVGAYSIGFFLFWAFTMIPSMLTLYFVRPCKPYAVYKEELRNSDT